MTDFTPLQIRMARAALNLGIHDFAKFCGVSHYTVLRIENATELPPMRGLTKRLIRTALRDAGLRFYNGQVETGLLMKNPGAEAPGSEVASHSEV